MALKQAAGKVMKVASASPDTGQHGGAPQGCAVSPCTVGEGGEGDQRFDIMHISRSGHGRPLFVSVFIFAGWVTPVAAQEINPVVITANRAEQPLSEVMSALSVISREEVERSQAPTLADLLQGQAGFEFGRNGGVGATTSIFLRGQNSTNLVVLVDGVRSQVDAYGNLQLADLPVEWIERVEILRGNASALYGDAAIGGVINVITRRGGNRNGPYGQVTAGTYGTQRVIGGYSTQTDGLRLDINAGEQSVQGFSAMVPALNPRVNPDSDGYRNRFASARLENRLSSQIKVGVRLNANDAWIDSDSGQAPSRYGPGAVATDVQKLRRERQQAGAFVQFAVNDVWTGLVDVSHSTLKFQDFINGQRIGPGVGASYDNGLIQGTQNALQIDNTWRVSSQLKLQAGATSQSELFEAFGNAPYAMKRDIAALYGGLTYSLQRWTFQGNWRRDETTIVHEKGVASVRRKPVADSHLLGLAYRLSPGWRLTSTYSTGFRNPGAAEVATNPALQPEQHRTYEMGLNFSDDVTYLRTVYFDTQTRNAIVYENTPPFDLSNIGEVSNRGVELTVHRKVAGFNVKSSLVVQDPWNVSENKALARRAKEYGMIDVSKAYSGIDWGARLYASGKRTDGATANTLSAYNLVSLYASKNLSPEWIVRLRADNLTDAKYTLAHGFNAPGRTVYLTLQYRPL